MKKLLTAIITACSMLLAVSAAHACGKAHKDGVKACHHMGEAAKACSEDGHAKSCPLHGHKAGPYFLSPADGATVSGKVKIQMGMHGMKVHKAGELIDGTGHHHLIIDGAYIPETEGVPKDALHLHFGKGQSETEIELAAGEHTLTLQFADGHHKSYGKVFSRTIRITVK